MIHFHYCKAYEQNVTPTADKIIQKKLNEYRLRANLKGINAISSYTAQVFILNIVNPHYKVILEERRIYINGEEVIVYFVRDIANMGQNFAWPQIYVEVRDGKWSENNPLPSEESEAFVERYLEMLSNHNRKLKPPVELTQWHRDYELKVEYDVFETEEWVKFALRHSSDDGMKDDEVKLFRLTLLELFKSTNPSTAYTLITETPTSKIQSVVLNDIGILYSELYVSHEPIYLLHGGANLLTQKQHWDKLLENIQKHNPDFTTLEAVQRRAVRAYPHWALDNAELWKAIQQNEETGNLSLLPEQTDFLKKFEFPKYINGQAGSGKSTMLYYLFANAYFYKCYGEIKGDLIFITENEELIKYTRTAVVDLLHCNPEFELSTEDISNVDTHFVSFKSFLLRLIPEDEKELFPLDKYLDFSKFKILYEASNIPGHIKRRYSAELVWFAVTTYIFGFDLELEINSGNFEQLMPTESRALMTGDVLRGMEREVIPFYKKLIDDFGYWDKIKIIKYIKDNVEILDRFEVIFCDEAQDFSRVELRFILNLSEYIKYDLSETEQVPIVFAGDALQTVNPTGFRSAEIKDMLYQELKKVSGFHLDTNNIEYAPSFNYRSSQQIVNVANAIQFYRKKNFGAEIKRPQVAKRVETSSNSHLNVFLDFGVTENNEDLRKKLEYKIFIIPTNSDEKDSYVEQHPFLNNFSNIKTAVEAKGIDYEQVVIYGFGEYYSKLNDKDDYEKRFFFNKLYVAVTRAQYELVIIDDKDTENDFWRYLIEFYADSPWAEESEVPSEEIRETILFGAKQVPFIKQSTPEMAELNAFKDKEKALFTKNPYLLKVAANQFFRLGNKKENFICLALMSKLQNKWAEAAGYYLNKDVGPDGVMLAAEVYWEGKLLMEYLSLNQPVESYSQQVRKVVAILLTEGNINPTNVRLLYAQRIELRKCLLNITWKNDFVAALLIVLHNSIEDEQIKTLIDVFEEITSPYDTDVWREIGIKNFLLNRFEQAIEIFDRINEDGVFFIKAHIEIARKRKNAIELIFWLGRLAIESQDMVDKESAERSLLAEYQGLHQIDDLSKNSLALQYLFNATIIHSPGESELDTISNALEKQLMRTGRGKELFEGYKEVLNSGRVDKLYSTLLLHRMAKVGMKIGKDLTTINTEYKKIAIVCSLKYIPFVESEIRQISEDPSFSIPSVSNHLQKLRIRKFRRFAEVNIENLGLVNLVVGDNNVGKTSFLESLLFSDDINIFVRRLAFAYIDRRNLQPDKEDNSDMDKYVFKLDKSFLEEYRPYSQQELDIIYEVENGRFLYSFAIRNKVDVPSSEDLQVSKVLEIDNKLFNPTLQLDLMEAIKQPFMPYGKGYSIDLAQVYYHEISLKPKAEADFLERMKIFIPTVSRVIADTRVGSINIFDSDYPDRYMPLHHYGEGANKLFRILVMLVLHRGGRVLIDEIDAGIHHSRFNSFWRTILEIAKKDNTQIIMTTHNEECIKFFSETLAQLGEEYSSVSRVVQLKNVGDEIMIRCYHFDDFNSAINLNLEIRGGALL